MENNLALLQKVSLLSPNAQFYKQLANGQLEESRRTDHGASTALATNESDSSNTIEKNEADDTFSSIREKIKICIESNDSSGIYGLERLAAVHEGKEKVLVLGECILAWTAIPAGDCKEALWEVVGQIIASTTFIEPERAWREWILVWIELMEEILSADSLLKLCAFLALSTDNCRPGLVGQAFVKLANAHKGAGELHKAENLLEAVRTDMKTNLQAMMTHKSCRFEVRAMAHWHRLACHELMILDPERSIELEADLKGVSGRLEFPAYEPRSAMYGPIAESYLSRPDYLGSMVNEIFHASTNDDDLVEVCYHYDFCPQIDSYMFALEKYHVVLPTLRASGCKLLLEPHIQEVVDALKHVDGKNP